MGVITTRPLSSLLEYTTEHDLLKQQSHHKIRLRDYKRLVVITAKHLSSSPLFVVYIEHDLLKQQSHHNIRLRDYKRLVVITTRPLSSLLEYTTEHDVLKQQSHHNIRL